MKKKKRYRVKKGKLLLLIMTILLLISAIVGIISLILFNTSHINLLYVSNNKYFSDEKIYQDTKINYDSNYYLLHDIFINGDLKNQLYTVNIKRHLNRVVEIKVNEIMMIGYYQKEDKKYLVDKDLKEYVVDDNNSDVLLYVPMLVNFNEDNLKLYQKISNDNPNIINKISEVYHHEETYDKQMFKLIMNDANLVFINQKNAHLVNQYEKIAANLLVRPSCIYFDDDKETAFTIKCQ
ncbi:MAG: hypothetical protein WBO70_08305 [Erysipelotrichaceae bacterium]